VLDIIGQKATCNRYPVTPLPYSEDARGWLESQMKGRKIPTDELIGASLIVEYAVDLSRKQNDPIPVGKFDSRCRGPNRGGAALERRAGKGKPDAPRRSYFEAHRQARAGEDSGRFIEDLTERLGGVGAVR
jgi:hypothetical protein